MEASALQLRRAIGQGAGALSGPLLRLRSDEQLVALFRAGSDEAFRVIHDRYRKRLLAYARQMLGGSGQDAEDALQDVFERAYCGLRASDRDLVLKAWLYRVAHNRCIDQLRRPAPFVTTAPEEAESRQPSPIALAEQRETLRRLILDVQRLPGQQRSALLMREMSGMSYAELAVTLDVSVPAVKSLLVRARMGLLAASEARDTACSAIREELVVCHDRGVRPSSMARRHLRDCQQCRTFRRSVRGVSRSLTAIAPALGPVGILIRLLTGGGAAGPGSMLGPAAGGAAAGGSVVVSTGVVAGGVMAGTAGHVATLLAAAIVTAGGAVAVQQAGTQTGSRTHVRPSHHLVAAPLPYSGGAGIAGPAVASQMSQSARTRDASGSALTGQADRGTKSGSSRLRRSTTGSAAARSTASSSPAAPSSTAPSSATGSGLSASGASSQSSSTAGPATSGPSSTGATSSGTTGSTSGTDSSGGAAIASGGAGSTTSGSTSGS